MKKKLLIGIGIFAALFVVLFLLFLGMIKLMNSRSYQMVGRIVSRVETDQKKIALTFDDGPTAEGEAVLDVLKEKQVSATFYLVGKDIEKYPEITQRIIQDGHQVGNHSYSHKRMVFKSPSFIQEEIDKTNELIQNAGYTQELTFRPPYGKKLFFLSNYVHQKGMTTVTWDVEPETYLAADASAEQITTYVVEHTKSGSIILVHPWHGEQNNSRVAVPQIIDQLKEKGFEFVTIDELLKL